MEPERPPFKGQLLVMAPALASLGEGRLRLNLEPCRHQKPYALQTHIRVDPKMFNPRILYAAELPVAGTPSAPGYSWDDSLLPTSLRVG